MRGWPFFSVRVPLSAAEIICSLWQQEITENAAQREASRRANRKRNCTDKPRQLTQLFHRQLVLLPLFYLPKEETRIAVLIVGEFPIKAGGRFSLKDGRRNKRDYNCEKSSTAN